MVVFRRAAVVCAWGYCRARGAGGHGRGFPGSGLWILVPGVWMKFLLVRTGLVSVRVMNLRV